MSKLKIKSLRKLAVGISLGLILVAFVSAPRGTKEGEIVAGVSTEIPAWEEVPEMKEVLSEDQETRLLATRKLVERVGVETALEIVENSPLPHTGEGHLAVHQIGFYAYRTHGTEGILKCKDYFLYACYHGVIIEAASDQGFEGITSMRDACRGSSPRFFQCAHAIGHSLLAMWNYDLPAALSDCDKVFGDESQFPDALSSCHNGAFMENLFGVHDWGTQSAPSRAWLSEDPYFPCNYFGQEYQRGCWLNQAARIYVLNDGDLVKTKDDCEAIGNKEHTEWCVDNLARQIHPLTLGSVDKVYELCGSLGNFWREFCVVVNAGSYYSVGDPETAIEVCNGNLSPAAKGDCYQRVLYQLVPDVNLSRDQKLELCQRMQGNFIEECNRQI